MRVLLAATLTKLAKQVLFLIFFLLLAATPAKLSGAGIVIASVILILPLLLHPNLVRSVSLEPLGDGRSYFNPR